MLIIICTFQIILSLKTISKLFEYFSCYMSFTIETEQSNKISFLDVNVTRKQGKFTISFYQKPTFNGIYTILITFY